MEIDADGMTLARSIKQKTPAASHRAALIGRWFDVMLTLALLTELAVLKRQSRLAANMPKHRTLS
jgi:hypothetical protein